MVIIYIYMYRERNIHIPFIVMSIIAIENGHRNSSYPLNMVIFHSYVSLPEGKSH